MLRAPKLWEGDTKLDWKFIHLLGLDTSSSKVVRTAERPQVKTALIATAALSLQDGGTR